MPDCLDRVSRGVQGFMDVNKQNLHCENLMNCGSGHGSEIPATGTRVPAAQHKKLTFMLLPDTRSFHQILCRTMCITENGE